MSWQRLLPWLALGAMLLTAFSAAAQGSSFVSSELRLEGGQYEVAASEDGRVDAVQIVFGLEYWYEQGALAREPTEIHLMLDAVPEAFEASLEKEVVQANVHPQGGGTHEEIRVVVFPARDVSRNHTADVGLVKVIAHAEENGNVQESHAEAQQMVPLQIQQHDNDTDRQETSAASTSGGSTGSAVGSLSAGVIGAVGGAAAGAVAVRRFL